MGWPENSISFYWFGFHLTRAGSVSTSLVQDEK